MNKLPHWQFGTFSADAVNVVDTAREEAHSFKHDWLGTEHLLLGLLQDQDGLVARVLDQEFDITLERVRARVVRITGAGDEVCPGEIAFTERAQNVLVHAPHEANKQDQDEVQPLHILLGILREEASVAARILLDHANSLAQVREKVLERYS